MAMTVVRRKGTRLASLISPSSINGAAVLRGASLAYEFWSINMNSTQLHLIVVLSLICRKFEDLKLEVLGDPEIALAAGQQFFIAFSNIHRPLGYLDLKASYSSKATAAGDPTESVKDLYDKISKSVEAETMPPNAWLWSMIEKCANQNDIDLLFKTLQNLRRFRLSNLRIHANFNCTLCLRVAEACARVGAINFGSLANVLLPLYAKKQNDAKLMVEIVKLIKRNHLPLQPSTADIVFRISVHTFVRLSILRGDLESLWRIEELRSDFTKQHTLSSSLSCAKGFLLEGKPENAAAIIHAIHQNLPDTKKADVAVELQKLVSEWPSKMIKHQKDQDRKALISSLRHNMQLMIDGLSKIGLNVRVDLDKTAMEESILY
ncbi:hypothetical protein Sjap_005250 [Stephania japonica]|uniref:Uncharacterized protein n=1 Tax=Stephania japonica TaxID=461633 RepID=A0AAP0K3R5_9MAGN